MGKLFRRILLILLLVVFFSSAGYIVFTQYQYEKDKNIYADAIQKYMTVEEEGIAQKNFEDESERELEFPPVSIDFESLQAINEDIVGWIYCEDSVINYPVLRGVDNDRYLHHNYEGAYSAGGAIFVDAFNSTDFSDSNSIIYGHHMKNKTMFATLSNWLDQEYYEEHPVMWLLTPEQNYKVILFSCYNTSAYSDTYTIFTEPGEEFSEYLKQCAAQSKFKSDIELDENGRYVVLSTCAYMFENARTVLHGMLKAVD